MKLRAVELTYRTGNLISLPTEHIMGVIEMDGIQISVTNTHSLIGNESFEELALPIPVYFFLIPSIYINPITDTEFTAVNVSPIKWEVKKTPTSIGEAKHDPCQTVTTIQPKVSEDKLSIIYFGITDMGTLAMIKVDKVQADTNLVSFDKVLGFPSSLQYLKCHFNNRILLPCYLFDKKDPDWMWGEEE